MVVQALGPAAREGRGTVDGEVVAGDERDASRRSPEVGEAGAMDDENGAHCQCIRI